MEDRTACYENIDMFSKRQLLGLRRIDDSDDGDDDVDEDSRCLRHGHRLARRLQQRPNALFGVFDGHCGADCAQYISTHLPLAIVHSLGSGSIGDDEVNSPDEESGRLDIESMFRRTFRDVNERFTEKARQEVLISSFALSNLSIYRQDALIAIIYRVQIRESN